MRVYEPKIQEFILQGLYGFETRSLMLKEQHRLTMFKNRALNRIFWTYIVYF
jgi:hypothetical protein